MRRRGTGKEAGLGFLREPEPEPEPDRVGLRRGEETRVLLLLLLLVLMGEREVRFPFAAKGDLVDCAPEEIATWLGRRLREPELVGLRALETAFVESLFMPVVPPKKPENDTSKFPLSQTKMLLALSLNFPYTVFTSGAGNLLRYSSEACSRRPGLNLGKSTKKNSLVTF